MALWLEPRPAPAPHRRRALIAAALMVVGCQAAQRPSDLVQTTQVSGCGGFPAETVRSAEAPGYCDAETLRWTYTAERRELRLSDERIELNCCGERSLRLLASGDAYVLREVDAPPKGGSRCRCQCIFDLALTASPIPRRAIDLVLIRQVSDEGSERVVFQGRLDLTQGSGFEIVDSRPSPFCQSGG